MKKPLIILLNTAALLTGACASQSTTPAHVATTAPAAATKMSPAEEYRHYVEEHARRAHAELHWYHIPDDDDVDKTDS